MKLNTAMYRDVKSRVAIASHTGTKGRVSFEVVTEGAIVSYNVVQNKKVMYDGNSSMLAAEVFNSLVPD